MTNIMLCCAAAFVLLSAGIFSVGSLDKKIASERRRGKKAGTIKLRRQSLFSKITCSSKKLITGLKMPRAVYWFLTISGTAAGAAVGKLLFYGDFFAVLVGIIGAFAPMLFLQYK